MTFIKRVTKKIIKYCCSVKNWGRDLELKKLQRMPRFTEAQTNIFGKPFVIADGPSFVSAYRDIWMNEMYTFPRKSQKPYIIDCGANVGVSVMYFKKLYPQSEIVAFEPDKRIFTILQKNIHAFGLKNITLLENALWNSEGVVSFFSEGADGGRIENNDSMEQKQTVKTVSLRPYLNRQVDFLKIDIEGAEDTVLKDIESLLKNVQNIFVEYHSFTDKIQTLSDILTILKNAGFRYHMQTPAIKSKTPFVSVNTSPLGIDNQLNIFAYRQ